MSHSVGDLVGMDLEDTYVGTHAAAPGRVVYSPTGTTMKGRFSYYVFDESAFVGVTGATDRGGHLTFTVTGITDDVSKVNDDNLPPLSGAFNQTYFVCRIETDSPAQNSAPSNAVSNDAQPSRPAVDDTDCVASDRRVGAMRRTEALELFTLYDFDKSETIDINELPTLLRALGFAVTEKLAKELLKKYDKNHDQRLNKDEWLTLVEKETLPDATSPEELRIAFKAFDSDGNGFVTKEELCKALTTMGEPLPLAQVEAMITAVDSDGDGRLDIEELTKLVSFRTEINRAADEANWNNKEEPSVQPEPKD
jgi:calmodulin